MDGHKEGRCSVVGHCSSSSGSGSNALFASSSANCSSLGQQQRTDKDANELLRSNVAASSAISTSYVTSELEELRGDKFLETPFVLHETSKNGPKFAVLRLFYMKKKLL